MGRTERGYGGGAGFRWAPTPVHSVLGEIAPAVGLAAAVYGYTLFASLALAIVVFATVYYVVGRAAPDVITEAHKVQRTLYFALLPVIGTATLICKLPSLGAHVAGGNLRLCRWRAGPDPHRADNASQSTRRRKSGKPETFGHQAGGVGRARPQRPRVPGEPMVPRS